MMNLKMKIGVCVCLVFIAMAFVSENAICKDDYKVFFKKIDGPEITKVEECKWVLIYDLAWGIYEMQERGCVEVPAGEISGQTFTLFAWPAGAESPVAPIYQGAENSYKTDSPVETGEKGHRFYVKAQFTYKDKTFSAESDKALAWVTSESEGVLREEEFIKATALRRFLWALWLISPPVIDYFVFPNIPGNAVTDGWNVLFLAKRAADNSGWGGKIAFWVIRLCAWIGLVAIIKSWRASHLADVFPLARGDDPLKVSLTVTPATIKEHSVEMIYVRMKVRNKGNIAIKQVKPSELVVRGEGKVNYVEGPNPAVNESLCPGGTVEFNWKYKSREEGEHRILVFKGYAMGTLEDKKDTKVCSRFSVASPVVISDSARDRAAGALRRLVPDSILPMLTLERRYEVSIAAQFHAFTQKWKNTIIGLDEELKKELKKTSAGAPVNLDNVSYMIWAKAGERELMEIMDDLNDIADSFGPTPTTRVMRAGIINHIKNAINWFKASEEVDRAIESRASQEIERIKRNSWVEWLWNLACISPLAGLLGTVTGISFSFKELAEQSGRKAMSPLEVIQALAPSINEALWTTIFGLGVAILLMFPYFYVSRKIEWIYSKWEEIYVEIAENL